MISSITQSSQLAVRMVDKFEAAHSPKCGHRLLSDEEAIAVSKHVDRSFLDPEEITILKNLFMEIQEKDIWFEISTTDAPQRFLTLVNCSGRAHLREFARHINVSAKYLDDPPSSAPIILNLHRAFVDMISSGTHEKDDWLDAGQTSTNRTNYHLGSLLREAINTAGWTSLGETKSDLSLSELIPGISAHELATGINAGEFFVPLFSLRDLGAVAKGLQDASTRWPRGGRPYGLVAGIVGKTHHRSIDVLLRHGTQRIRYEGRLRIAGPVRSSGPWLGLFTYAFNNPKDTLPSFLNGFLQLIADRDCLVPVESDLERQVFQTLQNLKESMRQRGLEFVIQKPMAEILPHVRPDFILKTSGAPLPPLAIEVMGYPEDSENREYWDRKNRQKKLLDEHGWSVLWCNGYLLHRNKTVWREELARFTFKLHRWISGQHILNPYRAK